MKSFISLKKWILLIGLIFLGMSSSCKKKELDSQEKVPITNIEAQPSIQEEKPALSQEEKMHAEEAPKTLGEENSETLPSEEGHQEKTSPKPLSW